MTKANVWSTIKIPLILTFLVTLVRLVGELAQWSVPLTDKSDLFSRDAGGGFSPLGILPLVPIFGFWFGWRVRRAETEPSRLGMSAVIYLAALAGLALLLMLWAALDIVRIPQGDAEAARGQVWVMATGLACGIVGLLAWRRLSWMLLVYAVLARIPVAALAYLDIWFGWGTHYGAVPPNETAEPGTTAAATMLAGFQFLLWVPITILLGGIFGCVGGLLAGAFMPRSREG